MADGSYRRKNIGFGREGEDPAKDQAYSLLDALGKGVSSDFIIAIINEWLEEQEGLTKIPGSDKFIINFNKGLPEKPVKTDVPKKKRPQPVQGKGKAVSAEPAPSMEEVVPDIPKVPDVEKQDPDAAVGFSNKTLNAEDLQQLGQAFRFDDEEDDDGSFNF